MLSLLAPLPPPNPSAGGALTYSMMTRMVLYDGSTIFHGSAGLGKRFRELRRLPGRSDRRLRAHASPGPLGYAATAMTSCYERPRPGLGNI